HYRGRLGRIYFAKYRLAVWIQTRVRGLLARRRFARLRAACIIARRYRRYKIRAYILRVCAAFDGVARRKDLGRGVEWPERPPAALAGLLAELRRVHNRWRAERMLASIPRHERPEFRLKLASCELLLGTDRLRAGLPRRWLGEYQLPRPRAAAKIPGQLLFSHPVVKAERGGAFKMTRRCLLISGLGVAKADQRGANLVGPVRPLAGLAWLSLTRSAGDPAVCLAFDGRGAGGDLLMILTTEAGAPLTGEERLTELVAVLRRACQLAGRDLPVRLADRLTFRCHGNSKPACQVEVKQAAEAGGGPRLVKSPAGVNHDAEAFFCFCIRRNCLGSMPSSASRCSLICSRPSEPGFFFCFWQEASLLPRPRLLLSVFSSFFFRLLLLLLLSLLSPAFLLNCRAGQLARQVQPGGGCCGPGLRVRIGRRSLQPLHHAGHELRLALLSARASKSAPVAPVGLALAVLAGLAHRAPAVQLPVVCQQNLHGAQTEIPVGLVLQPAAKLLHRLAGLALAFIFVLAELRLLRRLLVTVSLAVEILAEQAGHPAVVLGRVEVLVEEVAAQGVGQPVPSGLVLALAVLGDVADAGISPQPLQPPLQLGCLHPGRRVELAPPGQPIRPPTLPELRPTARPVGVGGRLAKRIADSARVAADASLPSLAPSCLIVIIRQPLSFLILACRLWRLPVSPLLQPQQFSGGLFVQLELLGSRRAGLLGHEQLIVIGVSVQLPVSAGKGALEAGLELRISLVCPAVPTGFELGLFEGLVFGQGGLRIRLRRRFCRLLLALPRPAPELLGDEVPEVALRLRQFGVVCPVALQLRLRETEMFALGCPSALHSGSSPSPESLGSATNRCKRSIGSSPSPSPFACWSPGRRFTRKSSSSSSSLPSLPLALALESLALQSRARAVTTSLPRISLRLGGLVEVADQLRHVVVVGSGGSARGRRPGAVDSASSGAFLWLRQAYGPLEVGEVVRPHLVPDCGQQLGEPLGLRLASDGEGVGLQRGLHLGIVEVNDLVVILEHVHLLDAGYGIDAQLLQRGGDLPLVSASVLVQNLLLAAGGALAADADRVHLRLQLLYLGLPPLLLGFVHLGELPAVDWDEAVGDPPVGHEQQQDDGRGRIGAGGEGPVGHGLEPARRQVFGRLHESATKELHCESVLP
uniref:Myosin motor domain-containing protein n=1 Tax=Macrostomum lignano TaxID=282301 RepID=A0A1I8HKH1_9PLAT